MLGVLAVFVARVHHGGGPHAHGLLHLFVVVHELLVLSVQEPLFFPDLDQRVRLLVEASLGLSRGEHRR